ncbi:MULTISPECIES: hydantoinase/oxoprolinase family protein [unclassified Saccharopolyspora]|uniref:hydantoinase/oxoprolinase family protein n=1 Tax=unclassified Saccharopolyspora TaxID=2646250 RepID=UPI001CD44A79|nr:MULTISPECIES: hydantoinase/oxoprolinase family protein [unclassified Saccharopolyspora]MCA1189698.1 hydantoinase/oxoprolinase family protein [Saccharopolyspora sp. 6T]MCA1226669.1 hydantoinase/oxoprolinase family protein [Saccharopolyspora sp. 6M]MCA1278964.1 hydantoinase/oxoprolinase family protein [Saccharopolyspora sp. 7B]
MTLHVGIDVGGTFTDAVAVHDGRAVRGKAFSTPDVTTGILNALAGLEDLLGVGEGAFYSRIDRFVLGNTIVTNAVDEQKYSAVGLLTTQGFRDTLRIARSARDDERDPHRMAPPPEIVERNRIVEVPERIDSSGDVLVPLAEDALGRAVERVLAAGAESLAVCLLWSFRNPRHEQQIGEYLEARHPELPYTLSSSLTPVYREYERMVTTTLDAAVKPIVAQHFDQLAAELAARGLRTRVQIMQVHGGFLSVEETSKAPIAMFNSGPVGGVTGARLLGQHLGRQRVLTADMGGTSLDAAAIIDDEFRVLPRAEIGGLPTSLTAVDIETIGAGGGSLAWIDGRGVMRVGPRSAGSVPGPACYGKGGDRPAVTDAALVMGLLNPDYYLGGTVRLHEDEARAAVHRHLAEPLALDTDVAAHGVYRLAVSQMANAVRKITVNRGHDPREFTLVGFGGACGLFAAAIAAEIGVSEVVVPRNAAVFSAYGLMHADSVFSAVQTTPWTFAEPAADLEKEFSALESRAQEWFETEGVPEQHRELYREADMKFMGQIFEVTTRLPSKSFGEQDKDLLRGRFIEDYEAEFGAGTAWTEAEVLLINSRVKAIGRTEAQQITDNGDDERHAVSHREYVDPATGRRRNAEVHRGFSALGKAQGPCLLEERDTTVYVPEGAVVEVVDGGHFLIRLNAA